MSPDAPIEIRTLADGGQEPMVIARAVADYVAQAQSTLELALYDVRLPDPMGALVAGALKDAAARGVAVRLAYNFEKEHKAPVPPPPRTEPDLIESLGLPTKRISGVPDLMHHKYVIRDRASVWTGSTNWTADSWSREENVIAVVHSEGVSGCYLEDFEQLWTRGDVEHSGKVEARPIAVGDATVRAWFSPGRGRALAHRIAEAIGRAEERVRIASPVITSAPILGTLAEEVSDGKLDIAGVVDATQMRQVSHQWHDNGNASWKIPSLRRILEAGSFTGKRSTPYRPGSVHDYMHAKVTVADATVFVGSYNLSHSGELNAENVLEIEDRALADRLAGFIDEVRGRYPAVELPADGDRP